MRALIVGKPLVLRSYGHTDDFVELISGGEYMSGNDRSEMHLAWNNSGTELEHLM
jgi:hypothetical protein